MRRSTVETLISFLLGAAWALALLGAVLLFYSFLPFGFFIAFLAAIVGSLFGLLCVVLLELAALQFAKYKEIKHQTHLLEDIKKRLDDHSICDN